MGTRTQRARGRPPEDIDWVAKRSVNQIVQGSIIVEGDFVLATSGTSEGIILRSEWEESEPPRPGQTLKVLIESRGRGRADDVCGMISLSSAGREIEAWMKVMRPFTRATSSPDW